MIIISKKVKNRDGVYFLGNNANDVTGSCTYIRFNGKQILLECGMFQNNNYLDSYRVNSAKFQFKPSEIDYVFVGHAHIDHIGLLPRLVRQGFRGKIIASHATAMLMSPLLLNCAVILSGESMVLSRRYQRSYEPLYTEEDVQNTLKLIWEYDEVHTIFELDEVVSFRWFENSHCIGARQLHLILSDKNHVKKSLLYTSDMGALKTSNHYLPNTEIPENNFQLAIMESTYGEPGRLSKKTREFDLAHLKAAIDTVFDRGGTVILPCFSFSRTQEILTNLYFLFRGDPLFNKEIIVDSLLSCQISSLYSDILKGDNLDLWNQVRAWKNVRFVSEKEESLQCVKDHKPKIVISSSGFCTNGRILSYLHEYLKDPNSMVIFTGYTGADNSYLSYRIKNYKENRQLKISGDPVENKVDCISLSTFSSHANRKDLIEYGSHLNTNKLILVHGSETAKNSLKDDLKKAISAEDKCFKVLSAVQGMVVEI